MDQLHPLVDQTTSENPSKTFTSVLAEFLKEYDKLPVQQLQALFSANLLLLNKELNQSIQMRSSEAFCIENVFTKMIPEL